MSIANIHTTECPYCHLLNEHNYFCESNKAYTIQFVTCQGCNNSYAVSVSFHSSVSAIWKLELVNNFMKERT